MSYPIKQSLSELKQKFISWRREKSHVRTRIPDHLWQEVLDLCDDYSHHKICKVLSLDRHSFQKRLASRQKELPPPASYHFIEIDNAESLKTQAIQQDQVKELSCDRILLERPDGSRMTFHLSEGSKLKVGLWIQDFLEERHDSIERPK